MSDREQNYDERAATEMLPVHVPYPGSPSPHGEKQAAPVPGQEAHEGFSARASNDSGNATNPAAASPVSTPPAGGSTNEMPLDARNGKQLGDVVVRVKDIKKAFHIGHKGGDGETIVALQSISLCEDEGSFPPIRKGEFVMIRGPSGGGKTTLLNIIGTIDTPTSGVVEILGKPISGDSEDDYLAQLRLEHIGFVFQTFNLIPTMSALENVELPMTLLGKLSEKERRARAKQLLSLVGLRNRTAHLPSELSGGEQQRVTIARALCNNPSILLLDEPTGDLDTSTTIEVMDLLAKVNVMAGTTMLMVTHNPDVECYADRILYVSDGKFAQQAINAEPTPLIFEEYEAYLKAIEDGQVLATDPEALARTPGKGEADNGADVIAIQA